MAWGRGLFRAWLALSVLWIVAVGAMAYSGWDDAVSRATAAAKCKHGSAEPWCDFQPGLDRKRVYSDEEVFGPGGAAGWRKRTNDAAFSAILLPSIASAFGIPLAALGFGLGARWVAFGFRKP